MSTAQEMIVQYLGEARAIEDGMVRTLQAHVALAPKGEYRRLLDRHLRQTEQHRDRLDSRLAELGESRSVLDAGVDALQSVAGQVLAFYRAPIDAMLGQRGEERIARNVREACAGEALEIATYRALEALATHAGDAKTAQLAQRICGDEERMLEALQQLIPSLTEAAADAVAD